MQKLRFIHFQKLIPIMIMFLTCAPAFSQNINISTELFEVSSNNSENPLSLNLPRIFATEVYSIDVNDQQIQSLPTSISFKLDNGTSTIVNKTHATKNATTGHISWSGKNSNGTEVQLNWIDNKLSGIINSKPLSFNQQNTQYEIIHDVLLGPKLIKLQPSANVPLSDQCMIEDDTIHALIRIDVLVAYSNAFQGAQEEEVIDSIKSEVMNANTLLNINKMNYQFNLVGIEPVALPTSPNAALNDVENNSVLLNLRDQYGADMVAMIVHEFDPGNQFPNVCGIANLPGIASFPDISKSTDQDVFHEDGRLFDGAAYMAMILDCGFSDRTFLHELSHNFGMIHEIANLSDFATGVTPVRPFAFGYEPIDTNMPVSIMECRNDGSGNVPAGVCQRNQCFSNGQEDSQGNEFNNRKVGIERASRVANYRNEVDPTIDLPPVIDITFPESSIEMFQSNAHFQAFAQDILDDNVDISWQSDRNGPIGFGEMINPQSLYTGSHLITATATDDAGNFEQKVIIVEISNDIPTPTYGLWEDMFKDDTYLALHRSSPNDNGFYWATYQASGDPTWYLTDLNPINNGRLDIRLDQTSSTSGNKFPIGDAQLRIINPNTAALSWNFDTGQSGVSFLKHRNGKLNTRNGSYFDAGDSGWGISFFVNIPTGQSPGSESLYLAYDQFQPIWLLGKTISSGSRIFYEYQYFTSGSCPYCSGSGIGNPEDVGLIEFNFSNNFLQQVTPFTLPSSSWQRHNRTLHKIVD